MKMVRRELSTKISLEFSLAAMESLLRYIEEDPCDHSIISCRANCGVGVLLRQLERHGFRMESE